MYRYVSSHSIQEPLYTVILDKLSSQWIKYPKSDKSQNHSHADRTITLNPLQSLNTLARFPNDISRRVQVYFNILGRLQKTGPKCIITQFWWILQIITSKAANPRSDKCYPRFASIKSQLHNFDFFIKMQCKGFPDFYLIQ